MFAGETIKGYVGSPKAQFRSLIGDVVGQDTGDQGRFHLSRRSKHQTLTQKKKTFKFNHHQTGSTK